MQEIIEYTNTVMTKASIDKNLLKDIQETVGSIHIMNAPYATGYLFTVAENGKEIHTGMYCNFSNEIDGSRWEYYLDFKTKEVFKLDVTEK